MQQHLFLFSQLGNFPAEDGAAPLLHDHNLKAVKIGGSASFVALFDLLGPWRFLPLGDGFRLFKALPQD